MLSILVIILIIVVTVAFLDEILAFIILGAMLAGGLMLCLGAVVLFAVVFGGA